MSQPATVETTGISLPVKIGDALAGGWTVREIVRQGSILRFVLGDTAQRSVSLALTADRKQSERSPLKPLYYERTQLPMSEFQAAGAELGQKLSTAIPDGEFAALIASVSPAGGSTPGVIQAPVRLDAENPALGLRELASVGNRPVVLTANAPEARGAALELLADVQRRGVKHAIVQTTPAVLDADFTEKLGKLQNVQGDAGSWLRIEVRFTQEDAKTTEAVEALVLAASEGKIRVDIVCSLGSDKLPTSEQFSAFSAAAVGKPNVSFAFELASVGAVTATGEKYPRLTDVATTLSPLLIDSARLLLRSRVGLPLCIFPHELKRAVNDPSYVIHGKAEGERDEGALTFGMQCGQCMAKPRCSGVAADYLELYGSTELVPFATVPEKTRKEPVPAATA